MFAVTYTLLPFRCWEKKSNQPILILVVYLALVALKLGLNQSNLLLTNN